MREGKAMTNWIISVGERLPEEDVEVLGVCGDGYFWVTSHHNSFFTDHDYNFFKITHWMPLPEPPEVKP